MTCYSLTGFRQCSSLLQDQRGLLERGTPQPPKLCQHLLPVGFLGLVTLLDCPRAGLFQGSSTIHGGNPPHLVQRDRSPTTGLPEPGVGEISLHSLGEEKSKISVPSLAKNFPNYPRHCRESAGADKSSGKAEEGLLLQDTLQHIRKNASGLAPGLPGGDQRHW